MEQKNAQWYYLSAIANNGLGNNVVALEHAKQAAAGASGAERGLMAAYRAQDGQYVPSRFYLKNAAE